MIDLFHTFVFMIDNEIMIKHMILWTGLFAMDRRQWWHTLVNQDYNIVFIIISINMDLSLPYNRFLSPNSRFGLFYQHIPHIWPELPKFGLYFLQTPQIWPVLPAYYSNMVSTPHVLPKFGPYSPNVARTPHVLPKIGLYSPYSPNVLPGENTKLVTMI